LKAPDIDFGKLCSAKRASRLALERFRVARRDVVQLYAGDLWTGRGERQFVNFLSLYINIFSRHLIAKSPRVMLSTFERQAKPVVSSMQGWANPEIEKQRLDEVFRRLVIDGLILCGIPKVCLLTPADAAMSGWRLQAGTPAIMSVDFDDFVYDTTANDFRQATFIGHRYRMPFHIAKDNPDFDPKVRKKLTVSGEMSRYNESGDEKVSELGKDDQGRYEEFGEFIDLWELYLPWWKTVVTLWDPADGDTNHEPLSVKEWQGPPCGPYPDILAYEVVPGNAMPKGPAQDLANLHQLNNRLFAKLARQAERQKNIYGYKSHADKDAERVKNADDGDMIQMDDTESVFEVAHGGPNPNNLAFFSAGQMLFDFAGGNISVLGGLGAQAKTARQETMLGQNAGSNVVDKQDRTTAFIARTMEAWLWYYYHHPTQVMQHEHNEPGVKGVGITRSLYPAGTTDRMTGMPIPNARNLPWEKIGLKVDPYSTRHATPDSRMQFLMQVLDKLMPMYPLFAQQGGQIDILFLLQKLAEYGDAPDLTELFKIQEPSPAGGEGAQGASHQRMMPQQTERNYTRESLPGRTQKGDTMDQIASLQGRDTGGAQKNGKPQMNGAY
jgi:hypothetical protein